jgi:hypothetical protein
VRFVGAAQLGHWASGVPIRVVEEFECESSA